MSGKRETSVIMPNDVTVRKSLEGGRQWPLSGVGVVLRRQLRQRHWHGTLWTGLLLLGLLGVSALLEARTPNPRMHQAVANSVQNPVYAWQETAFYLASVRDFTLRWLLMYALGASVFLLPLAGLLGARAVPSNVEAQAVQDALLTRLRAWDICAGRLLANLLPLLGALAISGMFWLLCALIKNTPQSSLQARQILAAHLVLFCGAGMMGTIGFLFAGRFQTGGMWGRGAFVALVTVALCLGGIVLVNPLVERAENPVPLINAALFINPAVGVASALKVDILRVNWLYERTDAHDYPFSYPAPLLASGLFALIGVASMQMAAWMLRRAYRKP